MPLLAGFLGGLFAGIAEFFAKWLAKKTAIVAAAISTFAVLTGVLFAAGSALVAGLDLAAPSVPGLTTALWIAVPDNFAVCMSICISTDTACALYRWNVGNLQLANSAT